MAKRLKFSKDAKFEGDLLKTSEDLAPQGGEGGGQVRAPALPDSLTGLHQ